LDLGDEPLATRHVERHQRDAILSQQPIDWDGRAVICCLVYDAPLPKTISTGGVRVTAFFIVRDK